jgi:hypothetical protein
MQRGEREREGERKGKERRKRRERKIINTYNIHSMSGCSRS